MAEKFVVYEQRRHDGTEFLPRKSDGSEFKPGEHVTLESPEDHYRAGRLGKIETAEELDNSSV
ncbi:MAG: hypothetical protein ABSG35_14405 [Syntrophobacteraceae bacterium]